MNKSDRSDSPPSSDSLPSVATLRMIDANLNRASEGLRTIEEVARFIIQDGAASAGCKTLRHDLASASSFLERSDLLSARDTAGDVGTSVTTAAEQRRSTQSQIVAAAVARTTQSLRVLEEAFKLDCLRGRKVVGSTLPPAAMIESIRYRLYDIAVIVETTLSRDDRRQQLARCRVYGLITAGDSDEALAANIRRLIDAKVCVLQLRDRSVTDRTLFERAVVGARVARQHGGLWIINDRADIAVSADADGVHVGQDELPVSQARRLIGPDRLLGLSTHDLVQVRAAATSSTDYIGCGPVFPSTTKHFDSHTGVDWLREVAGVYRRPAFAIGGVTHLNVSEVIETGIGRVAIAGELANKPNRMVERMSVCES